MSLLTETTNCTNTTTNLYQVCENYQEGIILWMCISVVSYVFGFPGALAIHWVMLQRRRKRSQITPHDIFLINVTIIDVIFLVSNLLEMFNYKCWHNLEFEGFVSYFYSFNMCGRPLFNTCTCVDCYLAVVHPFVYWANKGLTSRVLVAIAVWAVTFIFGFLCLSQAELPSKLYLVLVIALTLPINAFCDANILWTLKRSNPAGRRIHPKKKRALQIIIDHTVVTLPSYLPPVIAAGE